MKCNTMHLVKDYFQVNKTKTNIPIILRYCELRHTYIHIEMEYTNILTDFN